MSHAFVCDTLPYILCNASLIIINNHLKHISMEKIFDDEVSDYLKSSGVSEKEINRIKFDKLKVHSIQRLNDVIALLKNDHFDEVEQYTGYSASGDGYGSENDYINFGFIVGRDGMDILELCEMLKRLKSAS